MPDTVWNTPSIDINWGTTYPEIIPDIDPNWDINDWGIDFDGGGGTTGGNTDFWNQGLGGQILGGLTDFGIAGATAGMGISYMNKAQQAQQVQAERAAQAIRKRNTWNVGVQNLANYKELESQRAAEIWNRAHLNDPNVKQAQKRKMLANAAVNNIDPKRAALYSILMT